MNDKDKEAFENWLAGAGSVELVHAWQAACDYKQKEIDELENKLAVAVEALDHYANLTLHELANTARQVLKELDN